MAIITPQQLWENYNRLSPVEPTVINGKETRDIKVYFNGFAADNSVVRVYARLCLPENTDKPPVLVIADDFTKNIDEQDPAPFLQMGYALLYVDYAGRGINKTHYTLYPRTIESGWEDNPALIKTPPQDPENCCWYYWTSCILHAVTFLEGCGLVDEKNIGIIGLNEGAALVFKSSYALKLKAGMTFFCGDLVGGSEDYLSYKAALDSRAYCKNAFPVLINAATNEKNGGLNYLNELYSGADNAYFCILPRAGNSVGRAQNDNIKIWFDYFFFNKGSLPEKPQLNVFASEENLYAELKSECIKAEIFAAEDYEAALRNWNEGVFSKTGEKNYLSKIDVYNATAGILVFSNCVYQNGLTLSTPVIAKLPGKLGVKSAENVKTGRLLYQSDMGTEAFLNESGGLFEDKKIEIKEGPFGLSGASGNNLITLKPGDKRFKAERDSLLKIIMYSPLIQDVEFKIVVKDVQIKEFVCKKRVGAGDWSTVTLSGEDFKCLMGQPSFDKAVSLAIKGQDIIINSIIWV